MRLRDVRTGIELIDQQGCLDLLRRDVIGRLAVVASGGSPMVFPVNYAVDGETIVFRTAPGTKLDAGSRGQACFEIDHFDRQKRSGWSVVAAGRLEEVDRYQSAELRRLQVLPVDPWAAGERDHWMRLVITQLTGRRVGEP